MMSPPLLPSPTPLIPLPPPQQPYDLILAADVLYRADAAAPLLRTLLRLTAPPARGAAGAGNAGGRGREGGDGGGGGEWGGSGGRNRGGRVLLAHRRRCAAADAAFFAPAGRHFRVEVVWPAGAPPGGGPAPPGEPAAAAAEEEGQPAAASAGGIGAGGGGGGGPGGWESADPVRVFLLTRL
jgi:hypothetical protein